MLKFLVNKLSGSIWKIIAVVIIVIAAPDIIIGVELMALANIIGVDFFVLMYVAGFLLYLEPLKEVFKKYWGKYFSISENSSVLEDLNYFKFNIHALLMAKFYSILFVLGLSSGSYWFTVELLRII